ncbi:hypothetical protein KUCAC02_000358 [Chaenocephalus aceratus]|uniref:Uncharacterized protein n=1 Tax=Chaenocephalus aceratus TaxID=36190 RepID=A0ACB9W644_CHAAC|nr:hypothetical protein KUCAC02_000358 [Chaenocephalus aceratus]
MAWAGRAAAAAAELEMDKRKKRQGAAAPGDERVEAYMPRQVQGKSSWSVHQLVSSRREPDQFRQPKDCTT